MFSCLSAALSALALLPAVHGATYSLKQNNVGTDFLKNFVHEAIADPTHGRVTYVDQATATSLNLTFASGKTFIMRADHTTTLAASDSGRKSVRIKSTATYTTHALVMDIRHMPQGCGTWPAAWETLESNWPQSGEVDIVEGVNDVEPNQSTLHTTPGCTMPVSGTGQTGTTASTNCDTSVNGNAGCGVHAPTSNSYGPAFNAAGGGFYALERTPAFVKVWFWSRNDPTVPAGVKTGSATVITDNWGTPYAIFPSSSTCNLASHLGSNNIIINLTLCGDWAGAVFASDGCGSDCVSFVNQKPAAFANAYWDFARLSVYT